MADDAEPAPPGSLRDPEFIRRSQRLLEVYASYFRPEVRGFENLPDHGPFLVVGNHSGGPTPPDLPILLTAWWRKRGVEEPVYALFHSFFLGLPGVGPVVEKAGALEAGHGNAEAVMHDGGIVVVFPGGDHEAYRPWRDRNRIDFDDRSGFIRLALRMGVPVVPAVSIGAHETLVVLSRGEAIARRLPYMRNWRIKAFPIVLGPPWGITVGLPTFPLPAKVTVQLSPPFDWAAEHGPAAADNDDVVASCYEQITSSMQRTLDRLAEERSASR
jgi:1-acyl-sn-glycerol-3-phosphate acyltransferase